MFGRFQFLQKTDLLILLYSELQIKMKTIALCFY